MVQLMVQESKREVTFLQCHGDSVQIVLVHLVMQRADADGKRFCRCFSVVVVGRERIFDAELFSGFGNFGKCANRLFGLRARCRGEFAGQVRSGDFVADRGYNNAFDDVSQLPHVARPPGMNELLHRI